VTFKQLCNDKGFTFTKISEETGITVDYLSKLNKGRRTNPTRDILQKISETIGTTVDEVIQSL